MRIGETARLITRMASWTDVYVGVALRRRPMAQLSDRVGKGRLNTTVVKGLHRRSGFECAEPDAVMTRPDGLSGSHGLPGPSSVLSQAHAWAHPGCLGPSEHVRGAQRTAPECAKAMARPGLEPGTPRFSGTSRGVPRSVKALLSRGLAPADVAGIAPDSWSSTAVWDVGNGPRPGRGVRGRVDVYVACTSGGSLARSWTTTGPSSRS
jgi:hypothetical protein